MSVTLTDIAKIAGVTEGTVSRALRNAPRVAKDTRRRILEIAERHGYVPNLAARELVRGKTFLAGVIMTHLESFGFLNRVLEGIIETLTSAGYDAVVALSKDSGSESEIIRRLLQRRVQGFIIQPDVHRNAGEVYQRLAEKKFPVVFFDRDPLGLPGSCAVLADNAAGGRLVAERLKSRGCRKLAVVCTLTEFTPAVIRRRIDAFMETAGPETLHVPNQEINRLFDEGCDGVFAPGDVLAVLNAARERNVRIPDQLAIIGYDDLDFAPLLPVPLTTVRQPHVEMGQAAADAFLALASGRRVSDRIVLPVSLVARASG